MSLETTKDNLHQPRSAEYRKEFSLRICLKHNSFPNDQWKLNSSLRFKILENYQSFDEKILAILDEPIKEIA